jgi:hypothetical protein
MHDRKKRGCYIHTSIKECVDPRRTMNIQKEFESDELSLNFHEYKHAPIKTSQV